MVAIVLSLILALGVTTSISLALSVTTSVHIWSGARSNYEMFYPKECTVGVNGTTWNVKFVNTDGDFASVPGVYLYNNRMRSFTVVASNSAKAGTYTARVIEAGGQHIEGEIQIQDITLVNSRGRVSIH